MRNLPRNLPQLLRAAGLKVVEIDGWETRGRPASSGGFAPVGVLNHHTGARDEVGDFEDDLTYAKWMANVGRSDLPAPLVQLSLSVEETVYILAAGRANHAGEAKASGSVAAGDGNLLYVGIEWMLSGTQKIPAGMYEAGVTLNAVLLDILGSTERAVSCHYQTSVTGKWDIGDPDGIEFKGHKVLDVAKFRKAVKAEREGGDGPKRLNLGLINIPIKVGAEAWEECWTRTARRSGIFGVNESLTKAQRAVYADLVQGTPFSQFGLHQTPNPIFWRSKRFAKLEGNVHMIHGAAPGPLAKRFPGFNAGRYVTELVLNQREDGREFAVLCTHWVPNGGKVSAPWRAAMRIRSKRAVRSLARKHKKAGRTVFLMGDTNIHGVFRMIRGWVWYQGQTIDKVGGTVPGDASLFEAPTDHKHGVRAVVEL